MINFTGQLKKKNKFQIQVLIDELVDFYGDFYITRNNLRLFIKENTDLLYKCLKKGDKMAHSDEDGIMFVTGFSDKSTRKYIKPLVKDVASADRLIKIVIWNMKCDLWAKVKKNNPVKKALMKNNFRFAGDRGKEVLLFRKYIPVIQKNVRDRGSQK